MSPPSPPPADEPLGRLFPAAFAGFFLIGLAVLGPALNGPFVSDDATFVVDNPYVKGEHASLAEVWVPGSDAQFYSGGSYQPVTQTFHAIEWRLFGHDTRGYHVTNVALHAIDAALLVMLLCASSVPQRAALIGGAFFAFHPANVEAVAWISQSRSLLALGFALAALLALERRPLARCSSPSRRSSPTRASACSRARCRAGGSRSRASSARTTSIRCAVSPRAIICAASSTRRSRRSRRRSRAAVHCRRSSSSSRGLRRERDERRAGDGN